MVVIDEGPDSSPESCFGEEDHTVEALALDRERLDESGEHHLTQISKAGDSFVRRLLVMM